MKHRIVLSLLGFIVLASPLSAQAATAATTTCASLLGQGVPYYQCYVDVRIPELTALLDTATGKLQGLSSVDATSKNTLISQNQGVESTLRSIQASIDAGTDLPTVVATFKSINPTTRVTLYTSKAGLTALADRRLKLMSLFSTTLDSVEQQINSLASAGRGIGDMRTQLANIRGTIAGVNATVSAALASLIPLAPDNGDTTIQASNTAARQQVFANLKSVNPDMQTARTNLGTLITTLKQLSVKPSLTLSITPGKVQVGQSVAITWSASNATSCVLSGPTLSGQSGLSGSTQSGPLATDSTFVLTCNDLGGAPTSIQGTVTVTPVPTSCTFNGQTVQNGASITAYQSSSVPSGQQCISEQRTCTNGTLSGSYTFGSCSVQGGPDTIPPTVAFSAPDGAVVSGPWVILSAMASDNVGVVGVQFKYAVNGGAVATLADVTNPSGATYTYTWDSTSVPSDATVKLYAVARDAAGNRATSTESVSANTVFSPGAYGDTPITGTTNFVRPANGIQTLLFTQFAYLSSLDDYLPYLTKEFNYIFFEQSSLSAYGGVASVKETKDDVGPYTFDNLFAAIKTLKALNPNLKIGTYAGHSTSIAPWQLPWSALTNQDFIHDPSGATALQFSRAAGNRFVNTQNPATTQKLVQYWQGVFAANPGLDSLFLDGYGTYQGDPGLASGCQETTPSTLCYTSSDFWAQRVENYSTALKSVITHGDLIYNGIAYSSELNHPDQVLGSLNSGWTQWNDGALEEWAHEIYTSPDIFQKYIAVNTAVAAQGKKIFFYVQTVHLGPRVNGAKDPYPGLVWNNDLALEQFYLASYLLFENNPYTYFQYNPGTLYRSTQGMYYYENWNYDYGAPTGAYSTDANGLYSRTFVHGIAVVNPNLPGSPLTFTLPAGKQYRMWNATAGPLVSGTVTIPSRTGVFYFDTSSLASSSQSANALSALQSVLEALLARLAQ